MAKNVYRSAQGKSVDLSSLQLKNENVRAVGNMGVNARGDRVDGYNRPIDPRNESTARHYNKQVNRGMKTNTSEDPIPTSRKAAQKEILEKRASEASETVVKDISTPENKKVEQSSTGIQGGLASAIAKSREVKQEPLKTPKQLQQEKGIKRI